MTSVNVGRLARFLIAVVVLVGVSGAPSAAQRWEPTYTPDGAWLATATLGDATIPFMDIYTSHPNLHARQGTVLCTLSLPRLDLPLGPGGESISVIGTQAGHGSWTRVGKNVFAFTAWRILLDLDGNAVGWARFWGTIRPDSPDHFSGTMNAAFYTKDFVALPMPPFTLTTEGTRVTVEGQ